MQRLLTFLDTRPIKRPDRSVTDVQNVHFAGMVHHLYPAWRYTRESLSQNSGGLNGAGSSLFVTTDDEFKGVHAKLFFNKLKASFSSFPSFSFVAAKISKSGTWIPPGWFSLYCDFEDQRFEVR